MQARREEALRQRDELEGAGTGESNSNNPGMPDMGNRRRQVAMPMDPGMPGMMEDPAGQKVQVKTPEQILAEEKAKPYDKRSGYGRMLFGGSPNCEAVFDVEYVYLADPELE